MPASLRAGIQVVALKIQEASDMAHSDVRSKLTDAVQANQKAAGTYGDYVDHTGDGESGDVLYSSNGGLKKAPYEISSIGGKSTTNIDTANACPVTATVSYDELADDDDQYTAMSEAFKASNIYTDLPLYERFISKDERTNADADSFAGKNKSFPILKASDVGAAVHAMGQAGSDNYGPAQLKANIIRIAKAKGFASELPKAWQGGSTATTESLRETSTDASVRSPTSTSTEAHTTGNITVTGGAGAGSTTVTITLPPGGLTTAEAFRAAEAALQEGQRNQRGTGVSLRLFESAATLETIKLTEAKADYEIKLIAPGAGSSAFYPKEVLQRDGPKVFKAGTHVYLNHQTAAEEAARPEGDVRNLAGVLTTNAAYQEAHAKGPGLYARMKVFQDHAQTVEEKAPHVGMSIRASGIAESGKTREGRPVLKELTSAESVDVVTRAGAGGMILSESARAANSQEVEMTEADVKRLVESAVTAATSPLRERAVKGDAIVAANRVLAPLALNEAAKQFIIENVLRGSLPLKEGDLDEAKFGELVTAEAKRVGAVLGREIGVRGMGVAEPVVLDPKIREAQIQREKDEEADSIRIFESLGMPSDAAKLAAKGRAA